MRIAPWPEKKNRELRRPYQAPAVKRYRIPLGWRAAPRSYGGVFAEGGCPFRPSLVHNGGVGKTGSIANLDPRDGFAGAGGKVAPTGAAGRTQIGEQQIVATGTCFDHCQGLLGIGRPRHMIAVVVQVLATFRTKGTSSTTRAVSRPSGPTMSPSKSAPPTANPRERGRNRRTVVPRPGWL